MTRVSVMKNIRRWHGSITTNMLEDYEYKNGSIFVVLTKPSGCEAYLFCAADESYKYSHNAKFWNLLDSSVVKLSFWAVKNNSLIYTRCLFLRQVRCLLDLYEISSLFRRNRSLVDLDLDLVWSSLCEMIYDSILRDIGG